MDATQLYEFLYDWIVGVLPSVEVRQSHQDYPTPAQGPFLVLSYAGNWVNKGVAPSRMIWDHPELVAPSVYQWRGQLTIYEVDGNGELLQQLVESADVPEVKQSFGQAGVSILRSTGPQIQPALQDSNWRREAVLVLELSWARAIAGDQNYIESVELIHEKDSILETDEAQPLSDDDRDLLQATEINRIAVSINEEA